MQLNIINTNMLRPFAIIDANVETRCKKNELNKTKHAYTNMGQQMSMKRPQRRYRDEPVTPDQPQPSAIFYTCDPTTYTCSTSPTGEYSSADACSANCRASPAPMYYTCDKNTYTCVTSPTGEYVTQDGCAANCKAPKYRCAGAACVTDPNGFYDTPEACYNQCAKWYIGFGGYYRSGPWTPGCYANKF